MAKDESSQSIDLERFTAHYPQGGDLSLQILKGHLLAEAALREVFEMQLPRSEALNGERGTQLTCHQVICLTEAITPISQRVSWLWVALKALNALRNNLAHSLAPRDMDKKVDSLIEYVRERSPEVKTVTAELEIGREHDLVVTVVSICTCLSALKSALMAQSDASSKSMSLRG